MSFAMTLRAKGLTGVATRAGAIRSRFGFGEGEMRRSLDSYLEITSMAGARPTLPVTAVVLARHPALIREYAARGVEFAVHGLVHADHASLGPDRQADDLTRAAALFHQAGVPFAGFRGPYLRYSTATDSVLRELGFRYHSSQAIHYAVLSAERLRHDSYQRALEFYRTWEGDCFISRPRNLNGLLHIPVSVPDDEMLVERLGLKSDEQTAAWREILNRTHRDGELFTIQLHPERVADVGNALATILKEARAFGDVWLAQLQEIADWWRIRSAARIELWESAPARFNAVLRGADPLTLTVDRPDRISEVVGPGRIVEITSAARPVIGVPSETRGELSGFLREEGYLVERGVDPRSVALFLSSPNGSSEKALLAQVRSASAPLVRLARWPAGSSSALAVTGDIDSVTYQDFVLRLWETR